jgi:hypothetical protein
MGLGSPLPSSGRTLPGLSGSDLIWFFAPASGDLECNDAKMKVRMHQWTMSGTEHLLMSAEEYLVVKESVLDTPMSLKSGYKNCILQVRHGGSCL